MPNIRTPKESEDTIIITKGAIYFLDGKDSSKIITLTPGMYLAIKHTLLNITDDAV